jgi:hypothetical protein
MESRFSPEFFNSLSDDELLDRLEQLDSSEFAASIMQPFPLNPNEYRSDCIGPGFPSVSDPILNDLPQATMQGFIPGL